MSSNGVLVGTVVSVPGDGTALVDVGSGTVTALLNDATWGVGAGAQCTLLPVPGGYELLSTRTGGAAGSTLGPELVANGGVEFGTTAPTGWDIYWNWSTGEPSPAALVTDQPVEGERCLRITAFPQWRHAVIATPQPFRVDAGTTYRVGGWLWLASRTTPPGYRAVVGVVTADTQEKCAPLTDGARTREVASTVPGVAAALVGADITTVAGDNWLRPYVYSEGPIGTDLDLFIDAVTVRRRLS